MFEEYPKALYKGDQTGPMRIVADADEEAAVRADGFVDLAEQAAQAQAGAPAGRGRAAKG